MDPDGVLDRLGTWVPYDGIADVRLEVRGEAHRLGGAVEEGVNDVAGDVLDPAALVGEQFAKVTERVVDPPAPACEFAFDEPRSDEHTSELQSLMRISYTVFCLTKNS